jgi:diguanylate cyclase (GGDEF)-like protein
VAVVVVDLDNFKPVNDRFGHQAGDRVLIEIARRLETCVRENDTVARLGGDEFALLLQGVETHDHARTIEARIAAALAEPHDVDGDTVVVSASTGVSLSLGVEDRIADLLTRADDEMYQSKRVRRVEPIGSNHYWSWFRLG